MTDREIGETALLCNDDGQVVRFLCDHLGLGGRLKPGQRLTALVDSSSVEKTELFLTSLRARQAAFDWVINVPLGGGPTPLHFAGTTHADGWLIVVATSRPASHLYFNELVQINNEQTSRLRSVFKEAQLQARQQEERDSALYEELSQLNNELVTLQRELTKKNVELQHLSAQKNELLGMAAHDLRTPLSVIKAYSEFLIDETSACLGEEHHSFLHAIHSSSQLMLNLIDDLLDVTRIESGKLELDRRPTDWAELVQRNIHLNQVLAEKKGIRIAYDCEAEAPSLRVDAARMEQVLNNLMSNAIRYTPAGTTVRVRLGRDREQVVLMVTDEGPGIPADRMDQLFVPFARLAGQSASAEKSTGLGLAIARRIVEAHGGRVWAESKAGHGATFFVSLPIVG